MVNWRTAGSTDRLFGAFIAAHPSLKIQYNAIAVYFGQDATYDAIKGQLRHYRRLAEDLCREAEANGVEIPRGRNSAQGTPRTPRIGIRSGNTGSTGRSSKTVTQPDVSPTTTPTKKAKMGASGLGSSIQNAITLDDDDEDGELNNIKDEAAERQIKEDLNASVKLKLEKNQFHDNALFLKQETATAGAKRAWDDFNGGEREFHERVFSTTANDTVPEYDLSGDLEFA